MQLEVGGERGRGRVGWVWEGVGGVGDGKGWGEVGLERGGCGWSWEGGGLGGAEKG